MVANQLKLTIEDKETDIFKKKLVFILLSQIRIKISTKKIRLMSDFLVVPQGLEPWTP